MKIGTSFCGINPVEQAKKTSAALKVNKKDSFEKTEEFNPEKAGQFLSEIKDKKGKLKFNDDCKKQILDEVTKVPEKWEYVKKLAPRNNFEGYDIKHLSSQKDINVIKRITDIGLIDDKKGNPKFPGYLIEPLVRNEEDYNNLNAIARTDLEGKNIRAALDEQGLDFKKLATKVNEASNMAGKDMKGIVFARDEYSKGDYTIKVTKNDGSTITESLDNKLNRYALETVDSYKTKDKSYKIKKSIDYRNNTVSKVRFQEKEMGTGTIGAFKHYSVTHEVRVIKDKNGKVKRTEYTEPSEVKGVMNIKYQYPDGKTEIISQGTIDKKTGITTVRKNMVSALGTKTEYLFQDDPQGNRLSDYKITDKNGNVLLQNSETFEVVGDNKFISSKNGKKYEMTVNKRSLKVKDLDNPEHKASIALPEKGGIDCILPALKAMPGEELFKVAQTTKKLEGTSNTLSSYYSPKNKSIHSGDDLFIVLHELGHARDYRDLDIKDIKGTVAKTLSYNEQIQNVYNKEREAFNKAFPNAQRDHIDYFINTETHYGGDLGGLGETIAESNALLTTPKSHEILAMRSQYLQQYFPETIACLDGILNQEKE